MPTTRSRTPASWAPTAPRLSSAPFSAALGVIGLHFVRLSPPQSELISKPGRLTLQSPESRSWVRNARYSRSDFRPQTEAFSKDGSCVSTALLPGGVEGRLGLEATQGGGRAQLRTLHPGLHGTQSQPQSHGMPLTPQRTQSWLTTHSCPSRQWRSGLPASPGPSRCTSCQP